ncbi:hypothetical protein [Delftia acidovorans]|nr:hypothetical protein [Delftia acidovorans]MCG3783288.1 hypothetical protein [Delftia acidovorans]
MRKLFEVLAFLTMPLWIAPALLLSPFVAVIAAAWFDTRPTWHKES